MKQILLFLASLPLWYIGYKLSLYFKMKREQILSRKYYERCLYCKYMVNKGGYYSTYKDYPNLYCLHPDNQQVTPLDYIKPDFYCGKFELTEAYSRELIKNKLEDNLKSEHTRSFKGSKNESL